MLPSSPGDSFTVVVLGCAGTGKSALIRRFTHGYFVEEHTPTIEDVYVRTVSVGGKTCELQLWDTPSSEVLGGPRFALSERHQTHIARADGVLLCFSVTDLASFRSVLALHKQIQQLRPGGLPVLFVGNKADPSLYDERSVRQYDYERATVQTGLPPDAFMETCARQNRGCSNVFFSMARAILQHQEALRQLRKELKRSMTRGQHKRSLSTPSISAGMQPSPANSCADIVFDASAMVRGVPPPPPPPPPPPLPPQAGSQHIRSRSLSRMTTSLRRQREMTTSLRTATGATMQRRNASGPVFFTSESTSVSSCSANSADNSSGSLDNTEGHTLRSFNSCSNLNALQRTATLRRQMSTNLQREGASVRRSLSARNLGDMGLDRDHDKPAGLMVQKELERALQGVAAPEHIPHATLTCKKSRTPNKTRHRHTQSASLVDCAAPSPLPSTISECATETYGLRRSMELRALASRRLSDEGPPLVFQRVTSLPGVDVDVDGAASALSTMSVCDTDSALGSMSSTNSSSPEPDGSSISATSNASNDILASPAIAPPASDAARASTAKFKLSLKSWRFGSLRLPRMPDQAVPSAHG